MFLVDMIFTDVNRITPELTALHREHLEKEYGSRNLMFGGRKVPRTGGLILSRHVNVEDLTAVLESDPFVKSGAASYTITEFVPVMAAEDYADVLTQ